MNNLLPLCFIAHLVGDFLLQNDVMASRKMKESLICFAHVCCYSFMFWLILPPAAVALICLEHFLQDRFQLHVKWMRFYRQTAPDKWPTGPLCVDQSFHLLFITLVVLYTERKL